MWLDYLLKIAQWSFLNPSFFPPAKFDPPVIKKIQAKAHGCLTLSWSLSPQQAWMRPSSMDLELRVKTAGSSQWISKPVSAFPYQINWKPVDQMWRCGQKQALWDQYQHVFRPCLGQQSREDLQASATCSMALSMLSKSESDTRRAPGVNGAAASLESPWREVDQFTVAQSLSDIFQSVAFSSVSSSFQYMLMSCSTSPLAFP